jgi:hypothetical protein
MGGKKNLGYPLEGYKESNFTNAVDLTSQNFFTNAAIEDLAINRVIERNADGTEKYSLKAYNANRQLKLPSFDFQPKPIKKEAPVELSAKVADANRLTFDKCTGNLEISLFWEEKFFTLLRIAQLYSFFFFVFFEFWPSASRQYFTGMFATFTLSF